MKLKLAVLAILLVVVGCISFGLGSAIADNAQIAPAKIGVVSWRIVLNTCDKSLEMEKKLIADGKKIDEELTALKDKVVSLEGELQTSKPGGDDYMDKMREFVEKKAVVDAKEKLFRQELMFKEQRGFETMFQEVVKAAGEVAKTRGLDLVLAKDENQFPVANSNELTLTIRTSKVYYNADHLDITADVVALMNSKK